MKSIRAACRGAIPPVLPAGPSPVLLDGDAAASSQLIRHRRARTTIGDLYDAYRADMVTAYVTTRDEWRRLALEAEAVEFNLAHPGEPSLAAEMRAAVSGDPMGVAA